MRYLPGRNLTMKSYLIRILTVGVGTLLVGATALAQTVTPVTDFSAAPGNGVYSYASSTPATVMDLLQRNRPRPAATAQSELSCRPTFRPT
jgi:hypothetical protein